MGSEAACSSQQSGKTILQWHSHLKGKGIWLCYMLVWASLVAQKGKNLPAMWETWVWSLGPEGPLEEVMATHSGILYLENPMDRGAWQATVHGAAKSQTWLSDNVDWKVKVKVTQLYLTLCDPMDYTIHGILQARILEWVAFPFSRGSSKPRDRAQVSHIAGRFFPSWAIREAQEYWSG